MLNIVIKLTYTLS